MILNLFFMLNLFVSSLQQDQLLMVIEVCRHGARSPIIQDDNLTQTYWDMGLGMLTNVGMRQHYLLGSEIRHRYIEDQHLLDSEYNAEQIEIYSTLMERTYHSAISQFSGIYPDIQQNFKDKKLSETQLNRAILPILRDTDQDYQKLLLQVNQELGDNISTDLYAHPHVNQLKHYYNFAKSQYIEDLKCPFRDQIRDEFSMHSSSTGEFKAIYQRANLMLQKIQLTLNITNKKVDPDSIIDQIQMAQANGLKMPFTLTDQDYQTINDFRRYDLSTKFALKKDAALFDTQEIRRLMSEKLILRATNTTNNRLIILSLHDTDISVLLFTIDQPQNEQSPVATTIFFELHKSFNTSQSQLYVKAIYNDKQLNLHKYCYDTDNSTKFTPYLCDYETFISKLQGDQFNCQIQTNSETKLSNIQIYGILFGLLALLLVLVIIGYWIVKRSIKNKEGLKKKEFFAFN
ncbi:major acid phosphatase map (histidine-acid phosphatase) [Stylonychia lemnae]|uniref:Major acid phosphatase map (Histidine-acid phosphatase) n=1 Tax=Stylonychia lemnae TaxID=5949 RepID=A0A078A7X5_STYLE|nr:major acid phosphatase map (histidine-acid phosphatase) [Stylonychia lemnae]|eukprot:CDW78354.1 major acid phosphatase map (histidine-acid phosphatase) [Stylonychia lemnae]